jgi:hypothetical protein
VFEKYFSLSEARQQLTLVKTIVEDILIRGRMMKQVIAAHSGKDIPIAARRIFEEIETLIVELERMGCYYKDWQFEYGLVDFPAIVDGQNVLLCWRSDESDINWYHSIDDGYQNRKPLPVEWLIS